MYECVNLRWVQEYNLNDITVYALFAESQFAESMGHFADFFFGKVGKAVVYICKNRLLKL